MSNILNIIKDTRLTYQQRLINLAIAAENTLDVLAIDEATQKLRDEGIICDLFEGNAPYRPRYVVPDYEKFMKNGSEFLELEPPKSLEDAINKLLILYKHVPSISTFPVYLGNIDQLLEPFVTDDERSYLAIKRFLQHIDRTITDSFCHANIGPEATVAGKLILKAEEALETSIPNITLKYNKNKTNEAFLKQSLEVAMKTAKPSYANDEMFRKDFDGEYAIASCYNGLHIGGGSYTLTRVVLKKLADQVEDYHEFLDEALPAVVEKTLKYMDERIRFLVEEAAFFKSNFLVHEQLIDQNKFTAMFGLVGLAETVNKYSDGKFGHDTAANQMGLEIIQKIDALVKKHQNKYCQVFNGSFLLHAQVGIDTDQGISPGCRIPIGEEPELHEHIIQAGKFHPYFASGIGDIFPFEETYKNNPEALVNVLNGAIDNNIRYISFYSSDSDVIRITGYLVKKSEIEKLRAGKPVLRDTTALGKDSVDNQHIYDRKVQKNV